MIDVLVALIALLVGLHILFPKVQTFGLSDLEGRRKGGLTMDSSQSARGLQRLFESRRFWTMVLDAVVSALLYFGGKYAGASIEDIRFLIFVLQPIALAVIAALTVDDINAARVEIARIQAEAVIAQAGLARADRTTGVRPG